jgi:hypothetical protein
MTAQFAEQVRNTPSRRDPAYRPAVLIDDAEKAELAKKLGDASNYDLGLLREMVAQAPQNIEFRKALVSGIGTELLKTYGGEVGEYPDTLAGAPPSEATTAAAQAGASGQGGVANVMRDPIISLSVTNVALEGAALDLFKGTRDLGRKVNDDLMELVYDYNWADEVTHTAIGDYFVKALCDGNPEEEARALRAHAMFEGMRERLSGQQTSEIREFFAEEIERGTAALSGSGQ